MDKTRERQLIRAGTAADLVPCFENDYRPSGAGEDGSGGQTVWPGADDHGVVFVSAHQSVDLSYADRTHEAGTRISLERGDSHFARNGRILFQKFLEGVPSFQEVEQELERHTRPAKHWCSA